MRKIIITTGCDPREPWKAVLDLTVPRMEKYAAMHGYDFKALWYHDVETRFAEFHNPEPYVHGAAAYEVRKDFINWSVDRGMLAPNWIRYAAVLMLLEEYDVIVYMDGDLVIANFEKDVIVDMPPEKWLGASICGPSPDNAVSRGASVHHAVVPCRSQFLAPRVGRQEVDIAPELDGRRGLHGPAWVFDHAARSSHTGNRV